MNWTERRMRFGTILDGKVCVNPACVFDPISARCAEVLGFETGMLSGSIASHVVLGAPDLMIMTLTEFTELTYRIARSVKLPIIADADNGYGNALNTMRTVQELEAAGAVALTIEDTLLPRSFGATGQQLISVEEGIGKMHAALAARQDPSLTIVGRTGATAITGVEDAIARFKAYAATGVDALFLAGIKNRSQLDAIAADVNLPIILGAVENPELIDTGYLASRKVRVASQGGGPFVASVTALYEAMRSLRNGAQDLIGAEPARDDLVRRAIRDADYRDWTSKYMV